MKIRRRKRINFQKASAEVNPSKYLICRIEINIRHFAHRWGHAEKISLRFEAEHIRHEVARKCFAFVAVVTDVAVVKAARRLNSVFCVDQFLLQLERILVGLELRIIFHDDK